MMILPAAWAASTATSVVQPFAAAVWQASPALFPTTTAAASTPALLTSLTPALSSALVLTGGAAQTTASTLARFKLRLDGLHTYSVITTLLTNASLRLFSATPKRFNQGEHTLNTVKILFSLMVTLSVLTGSYTTIVFSLLELYSKRALGRNMDAACFEFFKQTQPIRERAYDTCIVSLVSFQVSFILSLVLNHDEGLRWKLALLGGLLATVCWYHWSTIMLLASTILQFGSDM